MRLFAKFVIVLSVVFIGPHQLIAQFESDNIELLAHVPNVTDAIFSFDIWGWTDPLTDTEYALIGHSDGVDFYDLTNPTQPEYVARWLGNGFDVKTYGNYAYTTRGIMDMSVLRTLTEPQDLPTLATYGGFHNIYINEETGYLYGADPSIQILDLADPLNPTFVDITGGSGHDAMSAIYHGPDTRYQGKEILFGSQITSFRIYDVSNKADVTLLSQNSYPQFGYIHQGWPSEDHRYFFLNDESDSNSPGTRTHVYDIADLEQPQYVGYYTGTTQATDHNLFVKGNLIYMANYKAGVQIVRVDDAGALEMEEIAFIDTLPLPTQDNSGFNGAFSVYPFFESGLIISSDMSNGLFVFRLDLGNDADFDDNMVMDCADVDALVANIAGETNIIDFDLTNDGLVTGADLTEWLSQAGESNLGPDRSYLVGDANLDGTVDGSDFIEWNEHKFTANPSWCSGDFNADGTVDAQDFILWNENKFTSADGAAVPEPSMAGWLIGLLALATMANRRTRGRKSISN